MKDLTKGNEIDTSKHLNVACEATSKIMVEIFVDMLEMR